MLDTYTRKCLPIRLVDRTAQAFTYVANRGHRRYAGMLSLEKSARLNLQGHGRSGSKVDYLKNTLHKI